MNDHIPIFNLIVKAQTHKDYERRHYIVQT